jgi:D-aspartate ligase
MDAYELIKKTEEPITFVLARYFTSDLGVIRSLKKKNIPTIVLNPNNKSLTCFSRYYRGITCPRAKNDEEKYVDFLINLGEKLNNKGVLLPVGDIELAVIFKNKSKLEKYYAFLPVDFNIVEKLLNKRRFSETVDRLNIPHSKTYFLKDELEFEKISKEIEYPCILKPVQSDNFRFEFKTKLFLAKSKEELIKKYQLSVLKNYEVIIQEIIPGNVRDHYGFNAYYDRKGEPNGSIMYQRIREFPHHFGNGCAIESIWEPELEEITTELVKKIGYHGIIDAEFKKDSRDNEFKIIEVNPRCWMQISLPTRCGINFPYMAYLDTIGKDFEKQMFNRKRVKWFFFPEDIYSSLLYFRKKELLINQWINSYKGEREYAVFSWDDPLPFFAMIGVIYGIYR